MSTVAIIDYGMGNLRSVAKAIERVVPSGCDVVVSADPAVVAAAERVVFPGQGSMPDCMHELDARGLSTVVREAAASKPFLGICIGLQMLFEHSAEGDVPGLGVLPGQVSRFSSSGVSAGDAAPDGCRLKVPHMGWNNVQFSRPHPLWEGIENGARFYFVHSYFVMPEDQKLTAAVTDYGVCFTSAAARANIFAVQFHPEKSAQAGLALLANFVRWVP